MRPYLLLVALSAPMQVIARRRCEPETRCINSPDLGLSETSSFFLPTEAPDGSGGRRTVNAEELALYRAGMAWRKYEPATPHGTDEGTCQYGHIDLLGTEKPLAESERDQKCYDYEGLTCGFQVTEFLCTCASRDRAQTQFSSEGYMWAAIVFGSFGAVMGLTQCCLICKDRRDGIGSLPPCDPNEEGCFHFYFTMLLLLSLPVGFSIATAWNLVLYARDEDNPDVGLSEHLRHLLVLQLRQPGRQSILQHLWPHLSWHGPLLRTCTGLKPLAESGDWSSHYAPCYAPPSCQVHCQVHALISAHCSSFPLRSSLLPSPRALTSPHRSSRLRA